MSTPNAVNSRKRVCMASRIEKQELIPGVYWVGAVDWAVRIFHGYLTDEGSSYNASLLMDEKPTLIDGVKKPFSQEYLERVSAITPLAMAIST